MKFRRLFIVPGRSLEVIIRNRNIVLVIMALLLVACGAPDVKKDVDLVWPLPPDEPRIKYLRTFESSLDVEESTSSQKLLTSLLGESEVGMGMSKPYGVYGGGERVIVTDTGLGRAIVFDIKNKKYFHIGLEGKGILSKPIGVAVDKEGAIYISDTAQDRVIIYDKDGKFKDAIGKKGTFGQPTGLAVNDTLGRLYIVDTYKHQLFIYKKDGTPISVVGARGSSEGEFNYPTNIFIGKTGMIYVSDSMNFRVQIFNADGKFIRKFGKVGDGLGMFSRPKGIAVDSDGHIYVVDAAFNNVQIFNEEGQILMFFGEMGNKPGQFWLPAGMYIDADDKIYVADQYNQRINVFQYLKGKYTK
jgi:DNA-binding beta-propeller fold protein YncE